MTPGTVLLTTCVSSHPSRRQALPPSYDQASSSSASAVGGGEASGSSSRPLPSLPSPPAPSPLANAPRSSHVAVFSANSTVAASHVLDLNRPTPPAVLGEAQHEGELDAKGRRAHGFWSSKNGSVRVDVGVQGRDEPSAAERAELDEADKKTGERVRIVARSLNGSARCSVVRPDLLPSLLRAAHDADQLVPLPPAQIERSPASTPFTVTATSANGSVHLVLPSSYHGPLMLATKNGRIILSARVKAVFTPTRDGAGFVGDMAGWDGTEDDAEARGLDIGEGRSNNGSVRVFFCAPPCVRTRGAGADSPPRSLVASRSTSSSGRRSRRRTRSRASLPACSARARVRRRAPPGLPPLSLASTDHCSILLEPRIDHDLFARPRFSFRKHTAGASLHARAACPGTRGGRGRLLRARPPASSLPPTTTSSSPALDPPSSGCPPRAADTPTGPSSRRRRRRRRRRPSRSCRRTSASGRRA